VTPFNTEKRLAVSNPVSNGGAGEKLCATGGGLERRCSSCKFENGKTLCSFMLFGDTVAGIIRKGSRTRRDGVRTRPGNQNALAVDMANQETAN
jgi:hypothetical protein